MLTKWGKKYQDCGETKKKPQINHKQTNKPLYTLPFPPKPKTKNKHKKPQPTSS